MFHFKIDNWAISLPAHLHSGWYRACCRSNRSPHPWDFLAVKFVDPGFHFSPGHSYTGRWRRFFPWVWYSHTRSYRQACRPCPECKESRIRRCFRGSGWRYSGPCTSHTESFCTSQSYHRMHHAPTGNIIGCVGKFLGNWVGGCEMVTFLLGWSGRPSSNVCWNYQSHSCLNTCRIQHTWSGTFEESQYLSD